MEFVQIVEFETDRPEDIRTLMQQWHASMQPDGGPDRVTVTRDKENPRRFRTVAEFASYEKAMAYSARPETDEFARRMRELATGEPRFVNLDVFERVTA